MNMIINSVIDDNLVNKINSLPVSSIITLKNTKGQMSSSFFKIRNDIKVRIIGGFEDKPKYMEQCYYDRTIYTPIQVGQIIKTFESIEKNIDKNWDDLRKSLYVYKILCENMTYDYDDKYIHDIQDMDRNLCGILNKEAVCAGFALIYKEAMDRLNIECLYQSKHHRHAWNVLKIDGVYYPIDLTFDVCHAKKNGNICQFDFFGNDSRFFDDSNHISYDELQVGANTFQPTQIKNAIDSISNLSIKKYKMNSIGNNIFTFAFNDSGYKRLVIKTETGIKTILFDDTVKYEDLIKADLASLSNGNYISSYDKKVQKNMSKTLKESKMFTRSDGTQFLIKKGKKKNDIYCYNTMFFDMNENNIFFSKIYSEDDLITNLDAEKENAISNILLSDERIKDKANNFGGYVGHLSKVKDRYIKKVDKDTEIKFSGINRW